MLPRLPTVVHNVKQSKANSCISERGEGGGRWGKVGEGGGRWGKGAAMYTFLSNSSSSSGVVEKRPNILCSLSGVRWFYIGEDMGGSADCIVLIAYHNT